MLPPLTSLQNAKIKNLVKLRRRRQRDQQRLMLIDGVRALTMALNNNIPIDTLYFNEETSPTSLLSLAQAKQVTCQPVSAAVFQKIGYGDHPDGYLGLAPQPTFSLDQLPASANPLYLVTEGLEKPGNLGAILRSADAAAINGLLICDSQTDIYNPNVVRASQGTLFTVPIALSSTQVAIHWLRERDVKILAATPQADCLYTEIDLRQPTAFVLGTEHEGLSAAWLACTPIRIPMAGQVDSLNVAQTATLLMFEARRQRELPAAS